VHALLLRLAEQSHALLGIHERDVELLGLELGAGQLSGAQKRLERGLLGDRGKVEAAPVVAILQLGGVQLEEIR